MKLTNKVLMVLIIMISLFTLSSCSNNKSTDITGYSDNVSVINRELPKLHVNENGDFKVLQITDTHLMSGTTTKDKKTIEKIKEQIDLTKPDLVIASGDIFEGFNKSSKYDKLSAIKAFAEIFEEKNQCFAYVPGNNDGEYMGKTKDVVAVLSEYSHCILSNVEGVTGSTHYTVDLLKQDNSLSHSLIFMDSLARDENNTYDYMKEDQVKWLKETLDTKKKLNIKTSVFFHMNTPNFLSSGKNGTQYKEGYNAVPKTFFEGINGNEQIDNVIKDSGIVGLVSIGHIHPKTNYCSFFENTYYHVSRATGYLAAKKPGCTLITIHTNELSTSKMYDFEEIVF